jgi:hypothetical protein
LTHATKAISRGQIYICLENDTDECLCYKKLQLSEGDIEKKHETTGVHILKNALVNFKVVMKLTKETDSFQNFN